jgi:hypothetical protein
MKLRSLSFAGWFALIACGGAILDAQDDAERVTRIFSFDNDTFAHTDDNYTSGLQIGWLSGDLRDYGESRLPSFITGGLRRLPLVNRDLRQRFLSQSLSHRMFTPVDTSVSTPITNDVPYSALLFGTLTAGAQDATRLDAFSFTAGLVGPLAGGEWLQKTVHKLIGSDEPRGWDNQLRDEPLLNVAYEHRRRLTTFGRRTGWGGDVVGQTGASAGNLLTSATLGLGLRVGWGVPDDFWIPPQFFGDEAIGSQSLRAAETKFSVWFFALVNGALLGNAIFWDGNTFHDGPSVDYDHWIGQVYAGIRVRYRRIGASFGLTATTVPWTNPENRKSQLYGRLSVSYAY